VIHYMGRTYMNASSQDFVPVIPLLTRGATLVRLPINWYPDRNVAPRVSKGILRHN
jgi:hypothetical protein